MNHMTVFLLQGFDATDAGHPRPPYGQWAVVTQYGDCADPRRGTHIGTCRGDGWLGSALSTAQDLGADRCSVRRVGQPTVEKVLRDGRWITPPAAFRAETTLGGTRLVERTFHDPDAEGGPDACMRAFVAQVRGSFPNVLRRQKIRIVGEGWDYEISGKIG